MNMPKRLARQLAMAASVGGAATGALVAGSAPCDGMASDVRRDMARVSIFDFIKLDF
jgi:hypothetical protein